MEETQTNIRGRTRRRTEGGTWKRSLDLRASAVKQYLINFNFKRRHAQKTSDSRRRLMIYRTAFKGTLEFCFCQLYRHPSPSHLAPSISTHLIHLPPCFWCISSSSSSSRFMCLFLNHFYSPAINMPYITNLSSKQQTRRHYIFNSSASQSANHTHTARQPFLNKKTKNSALKT